MSNEIIPKKRGGSRLGAGRPQKKPNEKYRNYEARTAYLEPETWTALESRAEELNSTVPELMRMVLRAYLEGMAVKTQNEMPNEFNRHLVEGRVSSDG